MPKQAFPGLDVHAMKKKRTRRELFLGTVVPWSLLLGLIAIRRLGRRVDVRRCRWRRCCGSTSCRTGMRWRSMAEEMLYDSRCGASPGSSGRRSHPGRDELPSPSGARGTDRGKVNGYLAEKGMTLVRGRWWMRRSSMRRPRPRTRPGPAIRRCRPRRKETRYFGMKAIRRGCRPSGVVHSLRRRPRFTTARSGTS